MVPDRLIPLTMFVGYTIPSILQGVIFLILLGVKVDPLLLLGLHHRDRRRRLCRRADRGAQHRSG